MKAYLTVYSPSGEEYEKYYLSTMIEASRSKSSIVIGRKDKDGEFDKETDIKLPPEEKLISRKHLLIELKETGYFLVKDLDSTHPALLRKATSSNGDNIFPVEGETPHILKNGDRLLLQSKFSIEGNSEWVLCFSDPDQTDPSRDIYPPRNKYEYDLSSKILYLRTAASQLQRIQFTGQRLKIVDYIVQKAKEEGALYIVPYEELISVIWPREKFYERTPDNLKPHVSRINKEISQQWGDEFPKLIDSVHGHGYRLNNCIVR
ncbi:MAG: FHA domain-containing protein [Symploca sp. SIO3E6]|nr:FHA domain-containing protein [Caldora sp. SIO3E6]